MVGAAEIFVVALKEEDVLADVVMCVLNRSVLHLFCQSQMMFFDTKTASWWVGKEKKKRPSYLQVTSH